MHLARNIIALVVTLIVSVSACTTWRRDPQPFNAAIPHRKPMQIWAAEQALTAHGIEVEGDSIRAVPRWKPPDCDTCAQYFRLADIDSVRVRRPSPFRTALLGAALAAWVYVTIGFAGYGGPGS
jgi:hypothetical protein